MTDFLKKDISRRRKEFELYDTDLDVVWQKIDKGLDTIGNTAPVNGHLWWKRMAGVAAAVVLAATSVLLWQSGGSADANPTLSMVSPDMAETEQYYSMMISEKMLEIEAHGQWIDPAVIRDLKSLDQAYAELRSDLGDNLDNDEVITAMITNYKIKLEVLDRILVQIKEVKNEADANKYAL